ncbi:hypothetical protein BKA58DRAFT_381199 [Alternaria rosae]|uniref:uncharacterized protein n=1 Tax=Alternaria rosae TaxID=1187941 RepID=UPI001E8EBA01|nr:uncharacterized protein BKA58DRAFT_381199 [Alternaria rosae]KAH6876192.1 hypothetical protein BKA58DRAFT_381199 [Alternaria rosae]
MPIFEPIKDAILYTWHTNSTLRFCCKLVTCPLFGLCYWIRYIGPITFHKCPGPPAPPRRQHALANIEYRRRVRRLKKRKRSVSVDRTRGLWRKNAEDQSQSPFLAKLPAELRLKIYEMVLCEQEEVGLSYDCYKYWDCWEVKAASGCNTKMLRTCKKMYREAIPLLYSQNTFKFEGYKVLSIFTSTILPQRLASIRNIVIDDTHMWSRSGDTGHFRHYEDLLASLGGIADLGEVVLRYRLRENKYRLIPRLHEFALLEKWEKEERPRGYEMFYEMLDVHPGPKIDGMLFDRWVIGERKSICRVDSNEDVE